MAIRVIPKLTLLIGSSVSHLLKPATTSNASWKICKSTVRVSALIATKETVRPNLASGAVAHEH